MHGHMNVKKTTLHITLIILSYKYLVRCAKKSGDIKKKNKIVHVYVLDTQKPQTQIKITRHNVR